MKDLREAYKHSLEGRKSIDSTHAALELADLGISSSQIVKEFRNSIADEFRLGRTGDSVKDNASPRLEAVIKQEKILRKKVKALKAQGLPFIHLFTSEA